MKTKAFQALLAQLATLAEVQRQAVLEAVTSNAKSAEAVALVEARFSERPCCGHCGAARFVAWGRVSGMGRYKCKACGLTFNALTGTPLARLRQRDAWLAYAQAISDGVSLRKAAARVGIALDTSFRWRHRFLATAKTRKATRVVGIVEADETFLLKSAKGSRTLVGRAPRKRGGKAKSPGLSTDEHDCILIVRDRHKATTDALLPDLEGRSFQAVLTPVVAKDALLVSDGRAAYRQFADAAHIPHISIIARRGQHAYGTYHIQNVNAYTSRFKGWLQRFRGVASKYLASYLGWRRMIERLGNDLTQRTCFAQAHDMSPH